MDVRGRAIRFRYDRRPISRVGSSYAATVASGEDLTCRKTLPGGHLEPRTRHSLKPSAANPDRGDTVPRTAGVRTPAVPWRAEQSRPPATSRAARCLSRTY